MEQNKNDRKRGLLKFVMGWPEQSKRIFSISVSAVLTLAIIIFCYATKINVKDADKNDIIAENNTDYITDTLGNLNKQFGELNEIIGQIGDESTTSTSTISTTSTSTATSSVLISTTTKNN